MPILHKNHENGCNFNVISMHERQLFSSDEQYFCYTYYAQMTMKVKSWSFHAKKISCCKISMPFYATSLKKKKKKKKL